jgi:hypothetical protein
VAETHSESPEARLRRYAYEDTTGRLMSAAAKFGQREVTDWNNQVDPEADHTDIWEWDDSPAGEHTRYSFADDLRFPYQEIIVTGPNTRLLDALKSAGFAIDPKHIRSARLIVNSPRVAQNAGAEVYCQLWVRTRVERGEDETQLTYEEFDKLADEAGLLEAPVQPSRARLRARKLGWGLIERLFD